MYVFGFSSDHIRQSITVWAEFLKVCFQAAAVASGWRDEAWNLTKEWKGLHRRHLTAVKTQTLTQRKDFECKLQVTAHLGFHLSKPCLLWLTNWGCRGIDFLAKMDAACSHLGEKPWQLWPEAVPKIKKGTGVRMGWKSGIWYWKCRTKEYLSVSVLWQQIEVKLPLNQLFKF